MFAMIHKILIYYITLIFFFFLKYDLMIFNQIPGDSIYLKTLRQDRDDSTQVFEYGDNLKGLPITSTHPNYLMIVSQVKKRITSMP